MDFPKRFLIAVAFLFLAGAAFFVAQGYAALAQAETEAREGDYRAAIEAYARAARLLFWRDDLWEEAAFAAAENGELPTAIYYFERAQRSERGQLALAYVYYQTGDYASAQSAFEAGAALYQSAAFYEGLASIYHAQKKWSEERRAVENVLRRDENNASAHYRLGLLLTLFEPELALPELTRAAKLDGQFESASQTLRAALALAAVSQNPAEKNIAIGRALGLVEEWDLALAAFERAVAADAQHAEAWAWLGEAKQHEAETLAAGEVGRAELERALEFERFSPVVRGLRGLYWQRREKYSQALTEYMLAGEYDPKNPAWRASVGETYAAMGDLVAALAAYQRATELAPTDAKYWRLLAVFCADNGIYLEETGVPAAQKAAELAPDDPLALDALGYAYYAANQYANAELQLSAALAKFPNHQATRVHLGMNYLAQGNYVAAQALLTSARDADPNSAAGILAARLLERYFP